MRGFAGGWIILRPGNVYGPGDDFISLLLTMARTLPVVPVIGGGDDQFQPIWTEDLAAAIGESVRRTDLHGRVLELAGEERTSPNDILDRLGEITGRNPARLPIPAFLADAGATMAGMVGVRLRLAESQLSMLAGGNWIKTPGSNALTGVFHIKPTPLDSGLRKLADSMPEQTPEKGVGAFKRRRYWIDIGCSRLSSVELFGRFRLRFAELMPLTMNVRAEPETPAVLDTGSTITMGVPVRGNVQMRVEAITDREAVLVTLAGHPLAGAVRFLSEQIGDLLRFQVQLYDRAANLADWVLMRTIGDSVQTRSWESMLRALFEETGGTSWSGIQRDEEALDPDKAARVESWLANLISARNREHVTAASTAAATKTTAGPRRPETTLGEDVLPGA